MIYDDETEEIEPTNCPYCGAWGPYFDESEPPSDYCHHDPAEVVSHEVLKTKWGLK